MNRVISLALCFFAMSQAIVCAEESQFAYVYTTDLLPKGKKEIEQWMTWRHNKAHGQFDVWEGRTELEYGVTDRFQMAVYGNYAHTRALHNGVDGATAPPESFAEAQPGPDDHFSDTKIIGFSLEGIYRLLSPYKDPLGLAVYFEPTVGKGLRELESKILLQKNFFDDRLILASNFTLAQEQRWLPADPDAPAGDDESVDRWDKETDVNISFAASYRFIENWSAGFEFMNEREWAKYNIFDSDNKTNSAYYYGPTVHYGGKAFFVTATFLEQLPWASDFANPAPGALIGGRTYADDFERYRLRVKAGYYF